MQLSISQPDPALFAHTADLGELLSPVNVGPKEKAIPTNSWWGNLLCMNEDKELDPIYPSPYAVFFDTAHGKIACSYLHHYREFGPQNDNGAAAYYYAPEIKNLQFSALYDQPKFQVEGWDDFGVQLAFHSGESYMRSYMCLGQAFTSIQYKNLGVILESKHDFVAINDNPIDGIVMVGLPDNTRNMMTLTLDNGQKWLIAWTSSTNSSVRFKFDPATQLFTSVGNFTGVVQAAIFENDAALQLYQTYAGTYVNGVELKCKDSCSFTYHWCLAGIETKEFLHFAMAHQEKLLDQNEALVLPISLFAHTRGPMKAHKIPSNMTWQLSFGANEDTKLSYFTGLVPPLEPLADDIATYQVVDTLTQEIQAEWRLPGDPEVPDAGYYYTGKYLQKYASLCITAAQLAKAQPELKPLADTALTNLKNLLTRVGSNSSRFPLVYDTVFKGIITREAIEMRNTFVDFGNAIYNDHHYHYGYFVTALGIVYTLDPTWFDPKSSIYRFVETLVRDVMNPNSNDEFFPTYRYYDWFLGHSYSHGVPPMSDGKDEESTTEELNFYYGTLLLAKSTQNTSLENLSKLMLKLAALSHQTYFFINDSNEIHPLKYRPNKLSGMLFDNRCNYGTWFSGERECIHGIQMLPVTPALFYSRERKFIEEEWTQILSKLKLDLKENAWASLLAVNQSRLDPKTACETLLTCKLDNGLSRAFALYMSLPRKNPSQNQFMPLSSSQPDPAIFAPTSALKSFICPSNVLKTDKAVPTNNWWGNVLSMNAGGDIDPIYPSPYAVFFHARSGTIACSYLRQYLHFGPINENGAIKYYFTPRVENLKFSGYYEHPKFQVERWDDFGVQLAFRSGNSYMRSYMCLGQAFTSIQYNDLRVKLTSAHAFVSIDGHPAVNHVRIGSTSNVKNLMAVALNNGQKWLIAWTSSTNSNVQFEFDQASQSFSSLGNFTGVVQAAFFDNHAALQLYQSYAGTYVNGIQLECKDSCSFTYHWTLAGTETKGFLHFALAHHERLLHQNEALVLPMTLFAHSRGPMNAHIIPANMTWNFTFAAKEDTKLSHFTGLVPPLGPLPADIAAYKLVEILTNEIHGTWSLPGSYYFKGKALQKYGSMCIVAAQLAKTLPEVKELAEFALTKYKALLNKVGSNTSQYPLVYDTVYKGIVSREGFDKHDINVEFGNAVYNDHHYHYGYFVTAVAIAYHLDPSWIDPTSPLYHFVETLLRDTINPSTKDVYFPTYRHFDWFLGHSYSHGVTCMVDGKDEESTSEELNFFYGAHLWAQATQNSSLEVLTKLMLKLVALSHQTYFLISDSNITHPPEFRKNKVSGILFDNKSDYATWFSPNRECIHGIQMLPVTPALFYVRDRKFVHEEWSHILSKLKLDPKHNAWTSLLAVNQSRIDPKSACDTLSTCAMDDGLSRAFALYMSLPRHCESSDQLVENDWVYLALR
ncbi:endo-1,3(4)-beta-glucanase [Thraustotheca clavata]|uniref:glucan endo-1,3-beta-D-glucosidase n=1 Tax=Thraustotheca clavata TaxID=74557 RepID=A0A1V9Z6W4_9STRA|nr:endo-1,3(4)-beta-glucanase [Thraustotheca clavata]